MKVGEVADRKVVWLVMVRGEKKKKKIYFCFANRLRHRKKRSEGVMNMNKVSQEKRNERVKGDVLR